MRYFTVILVIAFLSAILFAQAPDTLWTRTFGGYLIDYGYSVQQTTDGGYIIGGLTKSFGVGEDDVYLIKTDANGDTIWTNTFGGQTADESYSVQQTADGGYIIAGRTDSFGAGGDDFYLIKTDTNGDTLWTKTFGGDGSDRAKSVQQTTDGGYIVVGNDHDPMTGMGDVYLIKTDANGDTLWTKTFGGVYDDFGYSVQQTTDAGYIITGGTESFGAGEGDVYLIKTDALGDTIWTKTFGGSAQESGWCVQQTTDGGYIISGSTSSFGSGEDDVYLIKTDALGDTLWTKTFGGSAQESGWCVQQTTDGGYIIAGYTSSFGTGGFDAYLVKANANGDTLWTKTVDNDAYDVGESVQQTTDGGYIVVGYTTSIFEGEVFLFKIASDITIVDKTPPITITDFQLHQNYPNPFNPTTTIKYSMSSKKQISLRLYDLLGKEIETLVNEEKPAGEYTVEFNANELSSGIYFYQLQAGDFIQTKKMILMR